MRSTAPYTSVATRVMNKQVAKEIVHLVSYCSLVPVDDAFDLYPIARYLVRSIVERDRSILPEDVKNLAKISHLARIFRNEEPVEDLSLVASLLGCVMNFPECCEFEGELEELYREIERLADLAAPTPALSTDLQQKGCSIIQKLVDKLPQPRIFKIFQALFIDDFVSERSVDDGDRTILIDGSVLLGGLNTPPKANPTGAVKPLQSPTIKLDQQLHQKASEPTQGSSGSTSNDVGTRPNLQSYTTKRSKVYWTPREEKLLITGVDRFGEGKWKEILWTYDFNPVRTAVHLKDKWRNIKLKEGRPGKYDT